MTRPSESRAATWVWAALMLVLLTAGVALAKDYGVSWDEPDNAALGRQALSAYAQLRAPGEWQSNLESKGPFYVAMAEAFSLAMAAIRGSASEVAARHFAYFLSLPLAATALFSLGRRTVRPWAALAGALLFLTQPLFFGHAFINPKDTPFMGFFLVSMAAGAWMVEALDSLSPGGAAQRRRVLVPLAAGALLGLTTAIRLFGPFAGILITGLAVVRLRRRALGPLALYWVAGGLVALLAWPYLWANPWGRFWESLQMMLHFPWGNLVLYRGLVYASKNLPWHYLPFTTVIQLTLPALLLALAGGLLALKPTLKDSRRRAYFLVFGVWLVAPYAVALLAHSEVYDNSRQFLFALPPLFLFAAVAVEALMSVVRSPVIRLAILGLAIVPGVVGIARLHPFEYIYYNELVGGVDGAYRQYELDYWATSYREGMQQLNEIAPPGSTVGVVGPWLSASTFARPDLTVFKAGPHGEDPRSADYLMVLTRSNVDRSYSDVGPAVVQVAVDGALLSEVIAVEPASPK